MSMDLFEQLQSKLALLEASVKELRPLGIQYAEAEKDYRIINAKKTLETRDAGFPVTITSDVVKGMPDVARARFKRDCAQVAYEAARDSINALKLSIRILEAQLDREWRG